VLSLYLNQCSFELCDCVWVFSFMISVVVVVDSIGETMLKGFSVSWVVFVFVYLFFFFFFLLP